MKRPFSFRLVAVCLTLLFLPPFSWINERYGNGVVHAATYRCSAQAIMQAGCTNDDLDQLEGDAVQAFLGLHGLPASDSNVLYTYGRTDVRNEVRAGMLIKMLDIIDRQYKGATLTAHETNLYQWFKNQVWTKEKVLYQSAVNDRNNWKTHPCDWKPDADLAAAYQLSYSPPSICSNIPNLLDLFNVSPSIPTKDYFLAAALKTTYGAPLANAGAQAIVADMSSKTLISWGVAASVAAAAAIATAIVFSTVAGAAIVGAALPFAAAATAAGISAAGVVALPLIVVVLVVVAVKAGIDAVHSQETENALNDLDALNTNAQTNPPDLHALAQTNDGNVKLSSTLAAASLPETPSTVALPTHAATDPAFAITTAGQGTVGTDTLNYVDWVGTQWSARTWGGWFVQTGTTTKGATVTSITPTLQYVDWNGNKYFAGRLANSLFLIVKGQPGTSDAICPADPTTGLSAFSDTCSSSVQQAFQLQGKNGEHLTASLSAPPAFTTSAGTTFATSGSSQSFTINASGSPAPDMTFGQNPNSTAFSQSSSGPGTAKIVYNGSSAATSGQYTFSVQAKNINGTVTQNVTITLGDRPVFTSSPNANFAYGVPGSFLVTTTGSPVPTLTTEVFGGGFTLPLPAGLSLHDNGNGTATISGTPSDPSSCDGLILSFRVDAANTLGAVFQDLFPGVSCSSSATRVGPAQANFTAGLSNQVTFAAKGGLFDNGKQDHIAMTCNLASAPSWLSCTDNGNGTATLKGTPPISTGGQTFTETSPWVQPHANSSASNITPPAFSIYVAPRPMFNTSGHDPLSAVLFYQSETDSNGHTLFFANFAPTYLSNNSTATFTESGHLPSAVTFDGSTGKVSFGYQTNLGDAASAGSFPVTVVGNDGVGTQVFPISVYVYDAPHFTSDSSTTFKSGQANTWNIITSGFPKTPLSDSTNSAVNSQGMKITLSGNLPSGVTFSSTNGLGQNTGAGVLSGNPCAQCGGTYPLTLTAKNDAGTAIQNFTLTVPISQTINGFGTPSSPTYGVGSLAISGVTAGSGLPVSFASTTTSVCTVSGTTVTILTAGTCSITASQAGNANFAAAPNVTQSFTVNKAALTVTAKNATKTYGATQTFSGNEFTVTGLLNSDSVTAVTLTSSGAAATAAVAGSPYSTVPSAAQGGGLSNYTITYVNGTLTVNTVPLTITAKNATKTYGATQVFAGTEFTVTGLLNSDSVTAVTLTSSGTAATSAVAGSPYSIVPSAAQGSGVSNYAITYSNGTLTVNTAPLTITAKDATKVYGAALPIAGTGSTAFVTSGLTNGETIGSVTISPNGGDAANAAVGNYILTPSAATGGTFTPNNYSISYASGSLNVTAATLNITANNDVKTYGQTKTYGAGSTAFSSTGLLNGETIGSVTLTATGGSAGNAGVGTYTLTPSAATGGTFTSNNYAITYTNGALIVNKAVLTVATANAIRQAGTPNPTFATTITGFVNGETASVVTGSVAVRTSATDSSSAGTYDIVPSLGTLAAANYAFAFINGTLTVTPPNPGPTISSVSPAVLLASGQATSISVRGSNFLPITVVLVNGSQRPTIVNSSTQLTVTLNAADVATPRVLTISAVTPSPGGGTATAQVKVIDATLSTPLTTPPGISTISSSGSATLTTGSAVLTPPPGQSPVPAFARWTYSNNEVIVSEASEPAAPPLSSGMFYALVGDAVNTGVAFANPNSDPTTVSFSVQDLNGRTSRNGTFTIPGGGQLARFLTEAPFNAGPSMEGTVSFLSTLPVGVIALRGVTNTRGDFLVSTLPVVDLSAPAATGVVTVPQFTDGGGWSTTLLLMNPTNGAITGSIQFIDKTTGEPATVTVNGTSSNSIDYSLPSGAAQRFSTAGTAAATATGAIRVTPAGDGIAPSVQAVFSFQSDGTTVSESGITGAASTSSVLAYVELAGQAQSGLAIANTATTKQTVNLDFVIVNGLPATRHTSISLAGQSQVALFLSQIPGFMDLPSPLQGILRVSTADGSSSIVATVLHGVYNQRGDFLISSVPSLPSTPYPPDTALVIPHLAVGGGYTTTIIFLNSSPTGGSMTLQTNAPSGQPMRLP